ncbi:MAG: Trm112 family protein [Chloroflexi bacterium]|nr:Trm112 family protein [Chloroflexota bacterium]
MKKFLRFLFFVAVIGGIIYALKNMMAPPQAEFASNGSGILPQEPVKSLDDAPLGGQISAELLKILVCPEDKGPLQLVDDGKFLLNPRNGYKYPIRNGIPVMLIEEGRKYRDPGFASNGAGAQQKTPQNG